MLAAKVIELPQRALRQRRAKHSSGSFLSPKETLAVLRAAKERSVRDWAMILLAYRHGLRASEVCGLRLGRGGSEKRRALNSAAEGFHADCPTPLRAPRAASAR